MTIARFTTAFLFAFTLFVTTAGAQKLIPDSSFNNYGYRMEAAWGANKTLNYADGSVLVGGSKGDSLLVWKYTSNGMPDATFGSNGLAILRIGTNVLGTLEIRSIVLQRNQKIVVMGNAEKQVAIGGFNGLNAIVIARLNANGTPDATFNSNGFVVDKPKPGYEYAPSCLALDTTGTEDRFYVGSYAMITGSWGTANMWCISKYKNNGRPDSSFNQTGVMQGIGPDINPNVGGRVSLVHDLKVMAGGKLLVAGSHEGSDSAWFLFRLKPNGNFDSSYGVNGRVYRRVNYQVPSNSFSSARILLDGSAVLITHNQYPVWGSSYDSMIFYAVRQQANGMPMTTYGNNGLLRFYYLGAGNQRLDFDTAGRMLMAWMRAYNPSSQKIHFKRYNSNGSLDTSFGGNGIGEVVSEPILNDVFYNRSQLTDLTFTTDFKGVSVLGSRNTPSISSGFALYRYKFVLPKGQTQGVNSVKRLLATVYPIPATEVIYIRAAQAIQAVTMTNMLGQTVMKASIPGTNNYALNISQYPAGHYVLQIVGEDGSLASKAVEIR